MSDASIVLGLGSPNGDDQFGWDVVDALSQRGFGDHARKIRHPIDALPWLASCQRVHLADAALGLKDDETLVCLKFSNATDRKRIQEIPSMGTHDLGLYLTLMMARSLDMPTDNVTLWLGRASQFSPMSKLSTKTGQAIHECVNELSGRLCDARAIVG